MSHRRVRCPHCSRRYDVTDVAPGTRLRCGCSTVLRIPAWPAARRIPFWRIAAGICAGLVTIAVLVLALRPAPSLPDATNLPVALAPPAPSTPVSEDHGFIDDPVARLERELQIEFPASRFTCSAQARPFFIALENSGRFAGAGWTREFSQAMELASTVFRREIAERLDLRPVRDTLLPVLVLESRLSFDRYCESRNRRSHGPDVKGFYEYPRRRIVTYQDGAIPRDVLLHEATHQLVHYYVLRETEGRKVPVTYWMQEGLGCYFEPFQHRVDGEVGPDRRRADERLPMLKEILGRPDRAEYIPLRRLLGMTVDGIFDSYGPGRDELSIDPLREVKFCYAESWALVHFLRRSGPGHRRIFEAYLRRELAGSASPSLFEQLVRDELGLDLVQFEEQFVKYVQTLP
ncbi:MAG TPA: DUF1570 domain-containing protein [Planctomycetota bacterium]|nr:DUF1570 domain-containing protein [Planctomycetota bacterium]